MTGKSVYFQARSFQVTCMVCLHVCLTAPNGRLALTHHDRPSLHVFFQVTTCTHFCYVHAGHLHGRSRLVMLCVSCSSPSWSRWQHSRAPSRGLQPRACRPLPGGVIPAWWQLSVSGPRWPLPWISPNRCFSSRITSGPLQGN